MKLRFALTVVCAGLAVAACGTIKERGIAVPAAGSVRPTTGKPAKATKEELLAWVDKVCGIAHAYVGPDKEVPQFEPGNLVQIKAKYIEHLNKVETYLDKSIADLPALKDGPSRDSGKYVEHHIKVLRELKKSSGEARTQMQEADPKNPTLFESSMRLANSTLELGNTIANSTMLAADKDLIEAHKTAPKCQLKGS